VKYVLAALLTALTGVQQIVQAQDGDTQDWQTRHEHAVTLARTGDHARALAILDSILVVAPDNYPVRRDYVVIATWAGRCDVALKYYEPIRKRPEQEDYLLVPVAECYAEVGELEPAVMSLRSAYRRTGDDGVSQALGRAQRRLALDRRMVLDANIAVSRSDTDVQEWSLGARLGQKISDATGWYVRFLTVGADDPEFDTGRLNRVGVGVTHTFNRYFSASQEFATDVSESGRFGSTTTATLSPTALWSIHGEYATYAEDISMRAVADDIDAKRWTLSTDYHAANWKWDAGAVVSSYDFSDGNDRRSFGVHGGYALEMLPQREQRLIGEFYRTNNTLNDTVYFNPDWDASATLTYKLDLVYDSRFPRHVDHVYAHVGRYMQQGEDAEPILGVRYEQEYVLSDTLWITWGVDAKSHVYDGQREKNLGVNAAISKRL
jgi:tetratricopeptide (TPR) repeat protein